MIRKSITLKNNSNENIYMDLRYSEGSINAPAVIIVHGFKGFKDWGFFPDLGRKLTDSGYVTICFNFSRNGIGLDLQNFTELDKFAENNYSHELADLEVILEAIKSSQIGKRIINPEKLGVIGHSRGGAIAILCAAEHNEDFQTLITWSSISNIFRFSDEQVEQWNSRGYIEVENSHIKKTMRINSGFLDDLNNNKKRFDLIKSVKQIDIPSLFIHGGGDSSVPASESENLYRNCESSIKRLELLEGAGHTFGIQHPFNSQTPDYETVCDLTEHWLDSYLNI